MYFGKSNLFLLVIPLLIQMIKYSEVDIIGWNILFICNMKRDTKVNNGAWNIS